jgi:hypothetical protein
MPTAPEELIMKESPNKNAPNEDVTFIIEELSALFTEAEATRRSEMKFTSAVGSTFHARVMNAAKHLWDLP